MIVWLAAYPRSGNTLLRLLRRIRRHHQALFECYPESGGPHLRISIPQLRLSPYRHPHNLFRNAYF
jgi:hypothetical protein